MRRLVVMILALGCISLNAADPWVYGRIDDVQKSVDVKTKTWVVNTPINEEETTYTIAVHVGEKILTGAYQLRSEELPPPPEWTKNYPVKVMIAGDTMSVRGPTGEVLLRVRKAKSARAMQPLTADEKKDLETPQSRAGSMIGFATDSASEKAESPAPEASPPPAPAPVDVGTVTVRSTPYLSEVFVDGDSMGYTPAKINLAPGKHAFRVEKAGYEPWTKEITVTVGSELTVDASLKRSQK